MWISLTIMLANLDTVYGNLAHCLGYLSSSHGTELQSFAHRAIMDAYLDGDAWEKCVTEEKIPYISAIVTETLRHWTLVPICSPCTSTRDIDLGTDFVPAGTTLYGKRCHVVAWPLVNIILLTSPNNRTRWLLTATTRISVPLTSLTLDVI